MATDGKDVSTLSFCVPVWIQNFGLNATNILEYFYFSPFYDPESNNQVLRIQGADISFLKEMQGKQYIHVANEHEPALFIVKEMDRDVKGNARLREVYYCIEGTFYKAPDLYNLIRIRSKKIAYFLDKSFCSTLENHVYTAQHGPELFIPEGELDQALDIPPPGFTGGAGGVEKELPSLHNVISDTEAIANYFKKKS